MEWLAGRPLLFETVALMKQKAQSLRGLDRWIEDFLQAGRLQTPFSDKYPNRCLTCHLFLSAQQYAQYTNETPGRGEGEDDVRVVEGEQFQQQGGAGLAIPAVGR